MSKKNNYSIILILILMLAAPSFSWAQAINIDLGAKSGTATGQIIRLVALLTILSLAPSILMMVTSFTRIIVVLSLLRSAIGIQQTPPNSVLISLALFLTLFIMQPTFEQAYNEGIKPLIDGKITEEESFDKTTKPFHEFMIKQTRDKDLALFIGLAGNPKIEKAEDTPFRILIPAFMISELKRAFEIGFLIFLPFLIIDMMIASTLMSMGMMMLPPVLISLPFKLIFFVIIDGWSMLSESLVKSFGLG